MRRRVRVGLPGGSCVAAFVLAGLASAGCGNDDGGQSACTKVGADGGIARSVDGAVTIALRRDALTEDTNVCVRPDDAPPDVYGPAYRVSPNIALAVPATITIRHELPADPSGITIGRVDRGEFEAGEGRWIALPRLALDSEDGLVKASDDELALFYALVDDGGGASTSSESEDTASTADGTTTTASGESTTSSSTSSPTSDTSESGPGEDTTSGDSTTGDTGLVYPPECDDIYRGPYTIVYSGVLMPAGGSEDLAMSGDSTFVARDGTGLVTVDATASTSPHPLAAPFADTTLGLRYRGDGDLVAAQRDTGELVLVHPDGTIETFFAGLDFPNGVYPDHDGNVWVTEYAGSRVRRIDADGNADITIAEGAAAAAGANGILYDELRKLAFWTKYDDGELWRAPIGEDGTPGAAVMVADLAGYSDGIAMDICGNLYVVDQGAGVQSRIDRVFLDVEGEHVETEEIVGAGELTAEVANAQFGYGAAFIYEDALYAVGLPGTVFVIDVQIAGHPIAPVAN